MTCGKRLVVMGLLLVMVVAGCAGIPQRELGLYVDAYGQSRGVTEQVLTDLVAAREKIEAEEAAQAPPPGQATRRVDYVPPTAETGGDGQDAIGARLAALELVSQYNDILVAIAEGKRVELLQAKVKGAAEAAAQLLTLAGATIPGVGALSGLLQTAAGALQEFEDRRAFAEAVKDGAPLVDAILQFFIDETPDIVQVHEGVWDAAGATLRGEANRVRRVIQAEASKFAAPAAGSREAKTVADIEAALTAQLSKLRPAEITLAFSSAPGATPISRATLTQLQADLARVTAAVSAYQENEKKSPALRALMDQYVTTLRATQSALGALSAALDKPTDYTQIAVDLLDSAIAIKQQYAVYRAALAGN